MKPMSLVGLRRSRRNFIRPERRGRRDSCALRMSWHSLNDGRLRMVGMRRSRRVVIVLRQRMRLVG